MTTCTAFYERPAMIDALQDVEKMAVLDLGIGSGFLAKWLTDNGAHVTGVDGSSEMVEIARARLGSVAELYVHDLNNQPLAFLSPHSFDIIVSSLTFHYIDDWEGLMKECHRLLKPGGRLVYSVHHPFADMELAGGASYFSKAHIAEKWGEHVTVTFYRRSLTEMSTSLMKANLVIHQIIEPTPVTEARDVDARVYEKLSRMPGFLIVDARAV